MNYWNRFAEMLGLELEQEFSLIRPDGRQENENTYKIIEDGIYYKSERHSAWWAPSAELLEFLLMGDIKAVPLPWKPKDGVERHIKYTKKIKLNARRHNVKFRSIQII